MKHLIMFLLLLSTLTNAQNILKGYVKNDLKEYALEGANIFLENSEIGTASDENGYFQLPVDLKTDHVLVISFIGYKTLKVDLLNYDFSKTHTFALQEKILTSQTVLIEGAIANRGESPVSFEKISRSEIQENYTTQDVPEYISNLPSTMSYSEGGSGIGYNYLSIRGFDQRRISVSVNGIPQNEPEDHNVYWIDMPDLLGSTELIQVQRGAGSGVAGYPSVGGSINIITSPFSQERRFNASASVGSYNTRKYTASFSSGLIDNKYSIYAKVGQVLTSGYRNGSWTKINSYHISAVRYDENLTTQINIFGGPFSDGLVYNGLAKFAIKDKNLRRENLSWWVEDGNSYLYKGIRSNREIENFSQPHYELLNEYNFNENVTFNSALFLIIGNGFFDYDGSWGTYSYFRLTPEYGYDYNPDDYITSNLIIRAMVENKQWGWIPRVSIKHSNGKLILGGEFRFHRSVHWGAINFGTNLPENLEENYKYYSYDGGKDIINFFANENWQVTNRLNLLLETQVAYHDYKIENEKYLGNNFSINDVYINPRLGINYKFNQEINAYLAFARVTREPRLKNYYDAAESSGGEVPQFEKNSDGSYNFDNPLVKPETMNNLELGATFQDDIFSVTLNTFYMMFNNEIVKNGQLDRFGQPITGNMKKTIHAGVELSGKINITKHISFAGNVSYSDNHISEGLQYISDNSSIDLSGNKISGFPEVIANGILQYHNSGLFSQLTLKYVGDYYSDNYDNKLSSYLASYSELTDYTDNKVDAYFVCNILASYEFNFAQSSGPVKLFVQVNNIFDNLYAAYAVGKEFFPAAERNFLVGMSLGL